MGLFDLTLFWQTPIPNGGIFTSPIYLENKTKTLKLKFGMKLVFSQYFFLNVEKFENFADISIFGKKNGQNWLKFTKMSTN